MKHYTLFLLLIGGLAFSSVMNAAEVWGGKWDNRWMVFLMIEEHGDSIQVTYRWEERVGESLGNRDFPGKRRGPILEIGRQITARLGKDTGLLYGGFVTPRAANLVKLKVTSLEKVNEEELKAAGWKAEALDTAEVKRKVFEGVPADDEGAKLKP